ncbi:MAG: ABC transporter ATP-binding protein [Thermodesulfobacteriota bacterium]
MLKLEKLCCGYGPMQAVHALDMAVTPGRVMALLGANGAGKSSTLMSIAGHVEIQGGKITYQGDDLAGETPMQRVAAGIGLVPEGRRLFAELTVRENLIVGGYCRPKQETASSMEKILSLFPRLSERIHQRAGSLSGGEQQMVSIGRALMSQPGLLLVDELSLGLMPKVIDICYNALEELKKQGMGLIVVEQSTQRALEVADDVTVLESGKMVWSGTASDAKASADMIDAFLGLKKKG